MAAAPSRRIYWILAALAVAGVLLGLALRRSADGPRGAGRDPGAAPARTTGPALGRFAPRGRAPTAADVLGALGRATPGAGLVRVEGHVVDAVSREPVPGVEVVFAGALGEAAAIADAGGAYTIDVPPGDYRAFVRGDHVISVGQAPYERLPSPPDPDLVSAPDDQLAPLVSVTGAQRGVDLEVQRSGVVVGQVVDEGGRPVVGAVVRAALGPWRPVLGTHVAESGADGTFRLEVPAGYYALEAAHPDFAGPATAGYGRPEIMVYPEMETTADLTLARGCVVTGRAVRRDGSPAGPGAIERGHGDSFFPAGQLADDGTFRFTVVGEEELTLRAWPWKAPPAPPQTLRCHDGARHVVEFVVPDQGPDLTGRIVDAQGDPVAGAYVDVYGLTPGTMNQQERADAGGDWAVFALPAGEYSITAHVPGEGIASAHVTVPGRGVELRLSGSGSITGRALGVPDGASFQLQVAGCVSRVGSVVVPPTTRVVPVLDGRYRVDGLPACELVAYARTAARTTPIQVEVTAGGVATADVDLAPPRAKTVRVSVVDGDGDAVAGAQVMVTHLDPGAPSPDPVTTDARGTVTVEAHVGDLVHAFAISDPTAADAVPLVGQHMVSDAAGATEDAEIRLSPSPYHDP